ncbi:hypothetical protein [Desulfobacula sp.]|uniref:hypothetical protein n=1 Tax=Desulfobacula sp. TaxID=2593537 RepID=UPI00262D8A2F|nr:hypothetical protein [Desulfobacula sp.]
MGYDKTLLVDLDLILTGTVKNRGVIINNGNIINSDGNINQCGFLDENGSTGRGTILSPVQECSDTVDEALCAQYFGTFEFLQPDANNTCHINAENTFTGVYEPLIIRSGMSWYLEGMLNNFSVIHIEPGAELVVNGGFIENFSSYVINNQGLISIEKSLTIPVWGTIKNDGLINNPGVIDNYGDLVGAGKIQNICDGSYTVFPDWSTRGGPDADHEYDLSGMDHVVAGGVCFPFDTDDDGAADVDDVFPYDKTEQADSDRDGVGDNGDAFPSDPLETIDSDGDCVDDKNDAFPNVPPCDVDSNGEVTLEDAIMAAQILVNKVPGNPSITIGADSNGDGKIGLAEMNAVLQKASSSE